MESKKIAQTINIRVNLGNYQHVEISKYAEKEISYDSVDEMTEKEDQLTSEIMDSLERDMTGIPAKFGKPDKVVEDVKSSMQKALPDFMKGSEEPNLAKKKAIQAEAEAENKKSVEQEKKQEVEELVGDSSETKEGGEESAEDELFGDNGLFS